MTKLTKKQYYERKRRKRRIQIIRRCTLAGSILLTAILLVVIVIKITSALFGDNDTDKDAVNQNVEPTITATPTPIAPDKPGDASQYPYTGENAQVGWVSDSDGIRYFPQTTTYYADGWKEIEGATYYFNSDGYRVTGWNTVEAATFFFDSEGKLQPSTAPKFVALTYDDGSSSYTSYLLDFLEEHNAKATFFIVGNRAAQHRDTIKRMKYLGMDIGSHTYNHDNLAKLDADGINETMDKADEEFKKILGHGAELMRPVGGATNETVIETLTKPIIHWSLDTLDWKTRDTDLIVDAILNNIKDGDIVLMHDIYQTTLEATKIVIPLLEQQGYQFVTVTELAKIRGVDLTTGVIYHSFPVTVTTPTPTETPDPTTTPEAE